MRIAVCLSHFYPTIGGAENQLLQLSRQWVSKGHPTTVFTRPVNGSPSIETVDGVRIIRRIRTVSLGPLFGLSFLGNLCALLYRYRRDYDVLLAGQGPWEAAVTGLVRKRLSKPSVFRIANTGPFGDLSQLASIKGGKLLSKLVVANTICVGLSSEAKDEWKQLGGSTHNFRLLTNGVEIERFHPANENPEGRDRTVLFVGRLAEQKDPLTLLRAWQQLKQKRNARLLIAGTGPLEPVLAAYIQKESVEGVALLGQQSKVEAIYPQAGMFVLPSLSEGCSNALLEAMASGLAPVVTSIPGNSEIVNESNGRVFPPGDVGQLTAILQDLLDHPQQQSAVGRAARTSVQQRHSFDTVADTYLNLFEQLLENRTSCAAS